MFEFMVQNFTVIMLAIIGIVIAELLLLAHIVLRNKPRNKIGKQLAESSKTHQDSKQVKEEDDFGLNVLDLDDDDLHFGFL